LYASANIIRVVGKPEGRKPLEELGVDGRIRSELTLGK